MRRHASSDRGRPHALGLVGVSIAFALAGCMSISPQLQPTDFAALERLESRAEREEAYVANAIHLQQDTRGGRYIKGTDERATPRGWQSLDAILRSDATSAAALPHRKLRASRIMLALALGSVTVTLAGIAASAREGLDLENMNGTGAILLGGGITTLGLAIGSGIAYGQARRGYERAVDVYNDSLGLRLGVYTVNGEYIPPDDVLVDEEGYIILDQKELLLDGGEHGEAPEAELPDVAAPPDAAGTSDAPDAPAEPDEADVTDAGRDSAASEPPPSADPPTTAVPEPRPSRPDLALRSGGGLTLLPTR